MRAWQVTRYGRPTEALELVELPDPEPGPGELLVRTTASVLNYNEVDGCHGRYLTINPPLPYTLGMECVGEVVGTGAGAEAWLGRRVTLSGNGATGAHAELIGRPDGHDLRGARALDDVEAAAFFYPFHLAHLGLHERGRLQAGETVLVHAAAGGVGSAAVQLAVAAGARVIATVGSEEKATVVTRPRRPRRRQLPRGRTSPQCALEETDGARRRRVLRRRRRRRDDEVADAASAGAVATSSSGFASGIEAEEVPMVSGRMLCFGNFDIVGVILSYRDPSIPASLQFEMPVPVPRFNSPPADQGQAVQAHLARAPRRPAPSGPSSATRWPFEQLPQALEAMEARQTFGRVVVTRER